MQVELNGRAAIVTGASRGIGAAIAGVLAEQGADLFLVARSRPDLDRVAAGIVQRTGRRAEVLACDLIDAGSPAAAVAAAVAAFGRLDILVNNAGATKRGDFFQLTEADWSSGFGLKFLGAVRMTRAAWPHLKTSHGAMVNIVGIGSRVASAEFTIGGSVNSALINFTQAMADRGRTDGVRVNAINPGHIATDRLEGRIRLAMERLKADRETAIGHILAEQGIRRFGQPHEIGWLAAYLVSPLAEFIHGTIVDIDGGETRAM
ncbi:MAG: SDR family oxidoreductase [Alphaproteobacteria bacterium]|nr:SDR family oxidoreductase [Alphaproteobacteria bacterium]